ncbi:FAD-dependent oxidoreductase [Enterococcus sp. LJL98]
MRVLIIGGSHGGIATARHLKKINPSVEVIIIEQSNVLGYIGSSLNLYLENYVPSLEACRTTSPSQLLTEGINVMIHSKVTKVNAKEKTIVVTMQDDETRIEDTIAYDYLVLAMGSSQYQTSFSKEMEAQVTNFKSLPQAKQAAKTLLASQKIVIIGAGLIGFELAETLSQLNKEVVLLDRMNRGLFRYFDDEITEILLKDLPANVQLKLNSNVQSIEVDERNHFKGVRLNHDDFIEGDALIYAINPRPNIDLVADIVDVRSDGTIETNEFMQTSDPFIYAVGDLVSVYFSQSNTPSYIPLVTNAYRTGIIAATNLLLDVKIPFPTVQRTIASELFSSYLASTGINEDEAPYYGLVVESVSKTYFKSALFGLDESFELTLKFVFDRKTHEILGGQLISNHEKALELINTLSSLVTKKTTLDEILTMDFYFNPKFSNPLHFFNDLALEGILKVNQANV